MARPLRIELAGGRFHVTARGNDRRDIFLNDEDRCRFLEMLGDLPGNFGVLVHAYVLMDNHFHLMIETPRANLGRAMQWLGIRYSMWFNRRHRRTGHLFQGRFESLVIQDDAGWREVGRYLHLNPARAGRLAPGKAARAGSKGRTIAKTAPGLTSERLRILRGYKWSSYRGYAGYARHPDWVLREPLERLCGGKKEEERRKALRDYTEQPLRQGVLECPWDRLVGRLVLGTEDFARSLRPGAGGGKRWERLMRGLERRASWDQVIAGLEQLKGEKWVEFAARHGDWGRDAALWLGRRHTGLRLAELGRRAGGVEYSAVSQAIRRFGKRLEQDAQLRSKLAKCEKQLSNVGG